MSVSKQDTSANNSAGGGTLSVEEYTLFHGKLADIREMLKKSLEGKTRPKLLTPEQIRERISHEMPVLDLNLVIPEPKALGEAASQIVSEATSFGIVQKDEGDKVLAAFDLKGSEDLSSLITALAERDSDAVAALADKVGAAADTLLLIGEHLARPVLEWHAEGMLDSVIDDSLNTDNCPACGNPPKISMLTGEKGQRYLYCGMCQSKWRYKRIGCPHCGCEEQSKLRYFNVGSEPNMFVEVCDNCERYLKQVRSRKSITEVSLSDIDIASARLDILARREGFK